MLSQIALVIPYPAIDPEIFGIDIGPVRIAIRWYALAYVAGILLAWRVIVAMLRRPHLWPGQRPPMTTRDIEDFLAWAIVGIILGGRLGYVFFYRPDYYLANPAEILAVWKGGMSFHGGFLGVVAAAWLFARKRGIDPLSFGDALAVTVPIGLFLGRIANFINGELWGRPTDVPWAMAFPGAPCPEGWAGICARHPSQLYEAALEGLLLGALLAGLAFRKGTLKTPGFSIGLFLAGYGLSRFLVEFFREADPQFITPDNPLGHVVRLGGAGLSMGQLLSLPMILAGLGIMFWARRRMRARP